MAQEITCKSAGVSCSGDLYQPTDLTRSKRRPAIVMGDGFSLVKATLAEQAQCFVDAGFIVLAIDYRTFGNSGGQPRGQLFPLNEAEDFRNAVSYMQTRADVDPSRIGL